MATYATLTVDPDALLENREPGSDVVVKITTNTGGVIFDTATGKAILANWSEKIAGGAATTFSLPTTDGATNPTDFQYMIVLNYIDTTTRDRKDHWSSGWISFTADEDLAGVVGGQYVPPTWMTTATATLQTYVDSGQAAATAAAASATSAAASASVAQTLVLSDLGTSDGQMRAALDIPTSQTRIKADELYGQARGAVVYTTNVTVVPNAAVTVIPLAVEQVDIGGFHDPAADFKVTIPAGLGGVYAITGSVAYDTNTTGGRSALILHNGNTLAESDWSPAAGLAHTVSYIGYLNAGDEVQLATYQTSGASRNLQNGGLCRLALMRIGA